MSVIDTPQAIAREVETPPGLFRRLFRQRQAKIGIGLTAAVVLLALLGPLLLRGPDGPVRVGSARQRRLLLNDGRGFVRDRTTGVSGRPSASVE